MYFTKIKKEYDAPLSKIIKRSLETNNLDIEGTAYYDPFLDNLSTYYSTTSRAYFVLVEGEKVLGGIGLSEYDKEKNICELQKLYLDECARGKGLSYSLISFIEQKAREMGYKKIYLETHTNLAAAIHIYEKCGYTETKPLNGAVHSAMNKFYIKRL